MMTDCPSWCETDHGADGYASFHTGPVTSVGDYPNKAYAMPYQSGGLADSAPPTVMLFTDQGHPAQLSAADTRTVARVAEAAQGHDLAKMLTAQADMISPEPEAG